MLVKIEARILIFPGTDFHFPSTSVPPGTFLGSGSHTMRSRVCVTARCPSVRLSVRLFLRPIRLLQQRAAGLLLWARQAADINRSRWLPGAQQQVRAASRCQLTIDFA